MRSSCKGFSTILKPDAVNLAIDSARDAAAPKRPCEAGPFMFSFIA